MKLKTNLAVLLSSMALILFSLNTHAKIEELNAIVERSSPSDRTISFKNMETGKIKTLRYHQGARYINSIGQSKSINELDRGERVTLKLRKVKSKNIVQK